MVFHSPGPRHSPFSFIACARCDRPKRLCSPNLLSIPSTLTSAQPFSFLKHRPGFTTSPRAVHHPYSLQSAVVHSPQMSGTSSASKTQRAYARLLSHYCFGYGLYIPIRDVEIGDIAYFHGSDYVRRCNIFTLTPQVSLPAFRLELMRGRNSLK